MYSKIKRILSLAVEHNAFNEKLASMLHFFESWRLVVEISLAKCYDQIRYPHRHDMVILKLFKFS